MNRRLQDPEDQFVLPNVLEDELVEGRATCLAFNRRGTILATGREDGKVVLWDFEVRGVIRVQPVHSAGVTSLAWSRNGRHIVSGAADGSVVLWDVEKNAPVMEMATAQHVVHVAMNWADPWLCLASFRSSPPTQLDFREERSQTLPCLYLEGDKSGRPLSGGNLPDGVLACYDRSGSLVIMTLPRGLIAVLEAATFKFVDLIKVPGNARAANLSQSKKGGHLLVNYQDKDRVLRSFKVGSADLEGRRKFSLPELRQHLQNTQMPAEGSVLSPGSPLLSPSGHTFKDSVEKQGWQRCAFSSCREYVSALTAHDSKHLVHIWDVGGGLKAVLEGDTGHGTRDLAWHPKKLILAVVCASGSILLWTQVQKENWSAFAPDFRELGVNEEYVESEDIFDRNPKDPPVADQDMDGPEEIDILTEDAVPKDSSDEEDELVYLPVEIEAQDFDDKGQLVRKVEGESSENPTPQPSSAPESEPAISDAAIDSRRNSAAPEGRHRLAVTSRPHGEPSSLDNASSGKQQKGKRSADEMDEDLLADRMEEGEPLF